MLKAIPLFSQIFSGIYLQQSLCLSTVDYVKKKAVSKGRWTGSGTKNPDGSQTCFEVDGGVSR